MVTVDEIRQWPTKIRCFKAGSCHLMADTEEELHAFAQRLRLKREWFQPKSHPHYDLTIEKRVQAVALGAVEVSAREQAIKRMKAKGGMFKLYAEESERLLREERVTENTCDSGGVK